MNVLGKKSDDVADWLREKGFEAYIERFLNNGYDNLNVSILFKHYINILA